MTDTAYKICVKNGAGWRAYNTARIVTSTGAPYHEGQKFYALIDWINRSTNFRQVIVSVNDTLQRYNLIASGMTPDQAMVISQAEGSAWLARNQDALSNLRKPWRVTRWRDWIDRPDFAANLALVKNLAAHEPEFYNAIIGDVEEINRRRKLRGLFPRDEAAFKACSINYVQEEVAAFNLMTLEQEAAEIYPGSELLSTLYFNKRPAIAGLEGLAKRYFTRIDFARVKEKSSVFVQQPAALLQSA